MNIVANSYFLRKLRDLPFFTLDLGRSRKMVNDEQGRFRKLTEFEIRYRNLYETSLVSFGKIGNKVFFYEDVTLKGNLILVFKDDDIYEIEWTDEETKDIESYLLETLRKIDNYEQQEQEDNEKNAKMIEEYAKDNEVWIAHDPKNYGKKYMVNQTLSKEEYRKALAEKLGKKLD